MQGANLIGFFNNTAWKRTAFLPCNAAWEQFFFDMGTNESALLSYNEGAQELLLYHVLPQVMLTRGVLLPGLVRQRCVACLPHNTSSLSPRA